jgi:two-component system, response regulator PdtaR
VEVEMTNAPRVEIRALVAEDDALVRSVLESELATIGVTIMGTAADGHQAVSLTRSLRPDVVLMDIEMPEMNGLEAAREIQRQCPTPIVVVTVYSGPELTAEAATAGVGAYVLKPPRAHDLDRAITIARARFGDLHELRRLNAELRQALDNVKVLRGLLPICCGCKKIRDDHGYWQQVESYLSTHSEAEFTHSFCPDCAAHFFADDEE